MVMLPQFGDKLSSLELYLRVGGQVVGGGMLSDHSIGLNVQIPIDTENKGDCWSKQHQSRDTLNATNRRAKDAN